MKLLILSQDTTFMASLRMHFALLECGQYDAAFLFSQPPTIPPPLSAFSCGPHFFGIVSFCHSLTLIICDERFSVVN